VNTQPKKRKIYNLVKSLFSWYPLLKQPDSVSESRQVTATPSAPLLQTLVDATFIRFK
jgi:hypothetical protein